MTARRALPGDASAAPARDLAVRDAIIASLASIFPDLDEPDRIAYALRIKVDVMSALRRAEA